MFSSLRTLRGVAKRSLKRAVPVRIRFALNALRAGTEPRVALEMLWGDEQAFRKTETKLRARMAEESGLDDIVETAFRFRGVGRYRTFKPQQSEFEIKELLKEIHTRAPKTIVEIGTGRGGTLYLYCRYLTSATRIITVDLPQDARSHWQNARLWRTFTDRAEVTAIEGDSHGAEVRDQLMRLVGPGGADFIFIDGEHTYDGVKSDVLGYMPLLAEGGVMAMHDVNLHESGVPRFWSEFAPTRRTRTIVSPEAPAPGIGVIYG